MDMKHLELNFLRSLFFLFSDGPTDVIYKRRWSVKSRFPNLFILLFFSYFLNIQNYK